MKEKKKKKKTDRARKKKDCFYKTNIHLYVPVLRKVQMLCQR